MAESVGPYFVTELAKQGIFSSISTWAPNNDVDCPENVIGMYIGGSGNINALNYDGTTEIYPVLANMWIPGRHKRILSTSTTASGIRLLKG